MTDIDIDVLASVDPVLRRQRLTRALGLSALLARLILASRDGVEDEK